MAMDFPTFEDCLDRYGADLAAWPPASRTAGAALLESSPEARAALRALGDIEALLRADRPMAVAFDGVASRAMRARQDRPVRRTVRRAGWAVAAVAALVLGLFVGGVGPDHEDGPDHVMAAALDQAGQLDVD